MKKLLFVLVIATSAVYAQGPLTPSAAPAPTMKTLSQVEPRYMITNVPVTITRSGSYYFTTNIVYSGTGDGITIATNNVTIDLNGYSLIGTGDSSYDGITLPNGATRYHNIIVRNGTIERWSYGIKMVSDNYMLQNLRVISNYFKGADLNLNGIVENCTFVGNGDDGFFCFGSAAISRCTASGNEGVGFYLVGGSTIQNSSASYNDEEGIIATSGSVVIDCSVYANYTNGISVEDGSTVERCSVYNNYGVGLVAEAYCSIKNCNVSYNRLHGIRVDRDNLITDNLCSTNGWVGVGAGIYASGQGNRIENNMLTRNDYGLQITSTSNFVARNTARGNAVTNYSIAAGNSVAGIANVAGVSFTNTNPWSNFEY